MTCLSIEYARNPDRAPDGMMTNESATLAYLRRTNVELRIEIETCYQKIEELERGHRQHKDIFEEAAK